MLVGIGVEKYTIAQIEHRMFIISGQYPVDKSIKEGVDQDRSKNNISAFYRLGNISIKVDILENPFFFNAIHVNSIAPSWGGRQREPSVD